jgi:hypothetical protein
VQLRFGGTTYCPLCTRTTIEMSDVVVGCEYNTIFPSLKNSNSNASQVQARYEPELQILYNGSLVRYMSENSIETSDVLQQKGL